MPSSAMATATGSLRGLETKKKRSYNKNLWLGFLFGNVTMWTIRNVLFWPLTTNGTTMTTTRTISARNNNNNDLIDKRTTTTHPTTKHDCHGLNGTRVLLLDVHLEGNLGDELETTPLLQELHRCGIEITAVLSSWLETPQEQLGFRSVRAHGYIDNFQSSNHNYERFQGSHDYYYYDAIILAPGPWRLCSIVKWWPYTIDILVGGSILDRFGNNNNIDEPIDENCETIDIPLKQFSPKLLLLREPYSYEKIHQSLYFQNDKNKTKIVLLSGDLTHSIQLHTPSVEYWKRIYKSQYKNSILIFSRASNMDNVIQVVDRTVRLKTQRNHGTIIVTIPQQQHNKIVFATSSELEDGIQLNHWWKHKYYGRFQDYQFVICQTMEQLFGLISTAKHVYTDRYHPGVVAHLLNKNLTFLQYPNEEDKLLGLSKLVAEQSISPKTLREYNVRAFAELRETLRSLKAQRRRHDAS